MICHYWPLFALFKTIPTIPYSLFTTIRYSGFPDTQYFACLWILILTRSIQTCKKIITWPIFSFIIWLALWVGKTNQITCCDWLPEPARWSYLARLGLPAMSRKKNFPLSQIINPLLTKLFQSRWLDIGLVLFCACKKKDSAWYPAILTSRLQVNNPYILTSRLLKNSLTAKLNFNDSP